MIEMQSSAVRCDVCCDVEHPMPDRLGCRSAELTGAAGSLCPAEQVVSGEAQVHPDLVVDNVVERELARPQALVSRMTSRHAPADAAGVECGDIGARLVRDERGVADGQARGTAVQSVSRLPDPELARGLLLCVAPGCQAARHRRCSSRVRGLRSGRRLMVGARIVRASRFRSTPRWPHLRWPFATSHAIERSTIWRCWW